MLNIGDFARYTGVSVRMLRHYDALGLLSPTSVDPGTGYRRYDASLLPRAHQLVALKELGFSLEEVGDLLAEHLDADAMRTRLLARRDALTEQIARDRARLAEVERRLRLVEGGTMSQQFEERALPALSLIQVVHEVGDPAEIGPAIGPMYGRLHAAYTEAGLEPGEQVAWYDDRPGGEGLRFGAGFTADLPRTPGDVERGELPATARALVLTHRGTIHSIASSWQSLGAEVNRRGLAFAAQPCREVYRRLPADPTDLTSPDWEVELQQPVTT